MSTPNNTPTQPETLKRADGLAVAVNTNGSSSGLKADRHVVELLVSKAPHPVTQEAIFSALNSGKEAKTDDDLKSARTNARNAIACIAFSGFSVYRTKEKYTTKAMITKANGQTRKKSCCGYGICQPNQFPQVNKLYSLDRGFNAQTSKPFGKWQDNFTSLSKVKANTSGKFDVDAMLTASFPE